jgi:hypothetical protein
MPKFKKLVWLWLAIVAAAVIAVLMVPPEQSLGTVIRVIYFHGAWVWTGIALFGAAGVTGLLALLSRREQVYAWSTAFGWSGLFYWLTYLPMSLWLMQLSWNGFFFDEPRWRVPFGFAVVGSLLQLGLILIRKRELTAIANALFAAALIYGLSTLTSILHPDSPISDSNSFLIKGLFILVTVLCLASGFVLTLAVRSLLHKSSTEVTR